jgi:hypothetical protein
LGVSLYAMVFTENPFMDIDETILGELHPPFDVSKGNVKTIKLFQIV